MRCHAVGWHFLRSCRWSHRRMHKQGVVQLAWLDDRKWIAPRWEQGTISMRRVHYFIDSLQVALATACDSMKAALARTGAT